MYTLDFRVNYPVTLFGFVDSLSTWDQFVSKHVREYFNRVYVLNTTDKIHLNKYGLTRKKLSWDREIDLYNWAYAGLPDNLEFGDFITILRYFENRQDITAKTLKSELTAATTQLLHVIPLIRTIFGNLPLDTTVHKFADLFDSHPNNGLLPCYLTYSPNATTTQGGANGKGIHVEISTNSKITSQVQEAVEVITHEYMHKEINPGNYFKHFPDKISREIYRKKFTDLYPDKLFSFVEEVIIYALADVSIFKTDAAKTVHYYLDTNNRAMVSIWQSVCQIQPLLAEFMNGSDQKVETLNKLNVYFLGLVASMDY